MADNPPASQLIDTEPDGYCDPDSGVRVLPAAPAATSSATRPARAHRDGRPAAGLAPATLTTHIPARPSPRRSPREPAREQLMQPVQLISRHLHHHAQRDAPYQ
jgi:hypothetical protein